MTDQKTHPLTTKIEEALLVSGMSATRFGIRFFEDPAFVPRARAGRQFRPALADKIETILRKEFGL